MKRDIRNFVLIKAALDNSKSINVDQFETYIHNDELMSFLTLGEYDCVCAYKISEENNNSSLLNKIYEENNYISSTYDGSMFIHPMYAVINIEDGLEAEVKSFWSDFDDNFLFLSSVYLKGIDVSSKYLNEIKKRIDEVLLNRANDLKYLIYRSLDLSDFIIVWKSNNLRPVIESIKDLYFDKNIGIGHIKTICSLNYKSLKDNIKYREACSKINCNDKVDITTVSTINNQHPIYQKLLGSSNDNMFCVLGNDNFIRSFQPLKTEDLFEMFYKIIRKEPIDDDISSIRRCFTQVGINCNSIVFDKPHPSDIRIYNICKNIHNRLIRLKGTISSISEFEWMNISLELSNLMVVMSLSDIYNSVCLLLVDSVNFFCSWLEYVSDKKSNEEFKVFLFKNEREIQTFVRSWKQLLDNVVHSDGISVRVPGYALSSYNIYNTIVEYCGAYFRKLSKMLASFDANEDGKFQIAYIITPKLCRRIKTVEMFFDKLDKDSLLSLEIPIPAMLNPFLTITSLTHEAAHYYGEKTRNKKIRFDIYTICISTIMCEAMSIYSPNVNHHMIRLLNNRIQSFTKLDIKNVYLKDLKKYILKSALSILRSSEDLNDLYFEYTKNDTDSNDDDHDEKIEHILTAIDNMLTGNNLIDEHIERIAYFLKECYADIIMIYILNLSFEEYISVLLPEFERLNIENQEDKNKIDVFLHRIIMVKKVCEKEQNMDCSNILSNSKNYMYILDNIKDFEEGYSKFNSDAPYGRYFKNGFYSYEIIYCIIRYLEKCLRDFISEINKNEMTNDTFLELRKMYEVFVENNFLFSDDFQNTINKYRDEVLSNYDENGKNIKGCVFE